MKKTLLNKFNLVSISFLLALSAGANAFAEMVKYDQFIASNFTNSTNVDNKWMPLKPGMQFIYDGYTVDNDEKVKHKVIIIVTDLIKKINGVDTVVIWDRDFSNGYLEESELTFFAQDDDGNVWHLGQHSEIYEEDTLVGGAAWLVGHLEGAKAGIMMLSTPKVDGKIISQGFAPPPFNWTDGFKFIQSKNNVKTTYKTFENTVVTEEFNAEEVDAKQLKYYAPNVGLVKVGWAGADNNKETMELTDFKILTLSELDKIRSSVLELEKRAYVYGSTPPARTK